MICKFGTLKLETKDKKTIAEIQCNNHSVTICDIKYICIGWHIANDVLTALYADEQKYNSSLR